MTLPPRSEGYRPTALTEFTVLDMTDKDRIAALEIKLGMERSRVKELKTQVADLAERALELHFAKEQLEAEIRAFRREGEE